MIRLVYHLPIIFMMFCLEVVFIGLGWVFIPIAILSGAHIFEKSKFWDYPILKWSWWWMYPWGNEEDGLENRERYMMDKPLWVRMFMWSAVRNPANNLRFLPILSCKIDPKKVKWIGGPHTHPLLFDKKPPVPEWFYCWQGLYSGLWYQYERNGKVNRVWIGWKLYPENVNGPTGYQKYGAGFAIQWKTVK